MTSRSTIVTSAPRRAAYVAAVFPAGPPPMIRKRVATTAEARRARLDRSRPPTAQASADGRVGYPVAMRLHISIDDGLIAELDRRLGARERSAFIAAALRRALDDERRWEDIAEAIGSIPETGHEWDDDPAAWVRQQRHSDASRVG